MTIKSIQSQIDFIRHEIPKERFVEYEPSDLEWMKFFGIAKKRFMPTHVVIDDNMAYMIDMTKYAIPGVMKPRIDIVMEYPNG